MLYKNYAVPELPPQRARREEMLAREEQSPGVLHTELQTVDPDEARKHHPNSVRYIIRALEIAHFTGHTKTALATEQPVEYPLMLIGLRREKDSTNRLINSRIKQMMETGLVAEVEGLLHRGYTLEHPAMLGIGYKEIVHYIQ